MDRWRQTYVWGVLIVGAVLVVFLCRAWIVQMDSPLTYSSGWPPHQGYLEIQLKDQHPIEPVFNGTIFLYSLASRGSKIAATTVTRSAERGYGRATMVMPLVEDEVSLRSKDFQKFDLVAKTGLHRFFPFDSSSFDCSIEFSPFVPFDVVRLVNRVPGFVLDRDSFRSIPITNGVKLSFRLERSPLTVLFAVVLAIAALAFALLILTLTKTETIATASASFFLSLWSLRTIVASESHTFPTLFDSWILTVCIIFMAGLIWKVSRYATTVAKPPVQVSEQSQQSRDKVSGRADNRNVRKK